MTFVMPELPSDQKPAEEEKGKTPPVEKPVEVEQPVKRGRGRPKKVRTPEELAKLNAPKRPRGRPRKNPATTKTP